MTIQGLLLILIGASLPCAVAESVTVIMKEGSRRTVDLVRHTNSAIFWRIDENANDQTIPFSRLNYVDFPKTTNWIDAQDALSSGRLDEAIQLFSGIAQKKKEHRFPIPGNLASLAQWKLLECYEKKLDAEKVASTAASLVRDRRALPQEYQQFSPVTQIWIAIGQKKWDSAMKMVRTLDGSARRNEFSYLSGRVLKEVGKHGEALDAFTETYTFGFGSTPALTRDALRQSVLILDGMGDEGRRPELQAQLKIYQELFGAGELWEGAPETLQALAKEELDTMSFGTKIPPLPELPPANERDWIHALETDPQVYLIGFGAFTTDQNMAPRMKQDSFVFTGAETLRARSSLAGRPIHVASVFIPENPDGIFFNAYVEGAGLTLYLKGGTMVLAWKGADNSAVKEFPLGSVKMGTQTSLRLSIDSSGKVRGKVGSVPMADLGSTSLQENKKPASMTLGWAPNERTMLAQEIPNFQGIIRHFSLGLSDKYRDAEKEMFGGKMVTLGIPKPKS
ncbi:MAG: hypothetical protein AAGJ31_01320 [Verrucomicrobiota bacterium]